jgi:hypothetical protein
MATAADFRRIALSLEGTSEAQHFDRRAFRARVIYATLAAGSQVGFTRLAQCKTNLG